MSKMLNIVQKQDSQTYHFKQVGDRLANMTDDAFKEIVTTCKA